MTEAEKERAAIVAWLRGESEGSPRPAIWRYYSDQRGEYVHDLADAIERGDHIAAAEGEG